MNAFNRRVLRFALMLVAALQSTAIVAPPAPQPPPYFKVPVVRGSVGEYMCKTTGTGDARIAIITCDWEKYQYLPVYWQEYVMAHEHGHVYQVYYKMSFASSAAQE